ncbi:hypothetical protein NPIL_411581 [Nephila pilipes]|uniref:Uncharacterized protein n=1 Tax=Nephila pilipes TaxID=299642 RepID=A0A8X6MGF6_NEPPI|nr:hypothetical protein NPIL_411581 [Nephila pilipes]
MKEPGFLALPDTTTVRRVDWGNRLGHHKNRRSSAQFLLTSQFASPARLKFVNYSGFITTAISGTIVQSWRSDCDCISAEFDSSKTLPLFRSFGSNQFSRRFRIGYASYFIVSADKPQTPSKVTHRNNRIYFTSSQPILVRVV